MSTNTLSNANNEDEQDLTTGDDSQLQAMFEASYSGNDEESGRLQKGSAEASVEEENTGEETPDETVQEDDSIQIASTDLNEATTPEQEPQESSTDELATLREELHRANSDAGRVPHLNRRLQELERELTRLRTPATKPDNKPDLPDTLKTRLEKLKEIDPETAELMEEMYRNTSGRAEEVAASYERYVALQQQKEDEAHLQAEYQKVVSTIPEAEEVFRSNEWNEWKSRLTPNHRAMADSIHANEVITALQAFKVDAAQLFGGYKWEKPPVTTSATPQKSAAARAAEQSRANRLSTSATVKEGTARANTAELDLEALFKTAFEDGIKDYVVTK